MSKPAIAAALSALLFAAAPAIAQDGATGCPAPTAGHVKVFDGRTGADIRSAHEQEQEGAVVLHMRKTGGDGTTAQPAPRPNPLVKTGPGTLRQSSSTQGQNNLKQLSLATATCR